MGMKLLRDARVTVGLAVLGALVVTGGALPRATEGLEVVTVRLSCGRDTNGGGRSSDGTDNGGKCQRHCGTCSDGSACDGSTSGHCLEP